MIGVEPYEIHASGALFLLAVIIAITLVSWATRPQQGDRSCLPAWAWSVIATFTGVLVALAIAGFFFAVYLFYQPSPALGATLYPVPAECAALAQQHGLPDALTREQAGRAVAKLDAKNLAARGPLVPCRRQT